LLPWESTALNAQGLDEDFDLVALMPSVNMRIAVFGTFDTDLYAVDLAYLWTHISSVIRQASMSSGSSHLST